MIIKNDTMKAQSIIEKVVQIALARFRMQREIDDNLYQSEVSEADGELVVTFLDKAVGEVGGRTRGNPGKIPAFQVITDPLTFAIVSSHFVR